MYTYICNIIYIYAHKNMGKNMSLSPLCAPLCSLMASLCSLMASYSPCHQALFVLLNGLFLRCDMALLLLKRALLPLYKASFDTCMLRYIPHVIEPSIGVDRLFLALMCSAYDEDIVGGEKRSGISEPFLKK